ncbi:NUDIX hydrolase [Cytobacillus purgationiresistens]|uniref:8-oxo-dGTP pyrophosphatase MutT (NUDIX family) n=1 Tax=Cytobacillus purgationiresistens TaxID=863449 RepID=A0ABU0AS28_9BACI|nr:NUDIX hydrolase [Cytobacillus purgationiresistens]MDQ0272855.1 8-oxo-dGTP pyrophosphatase MutT (NUDIX family) [Cytobacillus purgationiresistens]
MEYFKELRKKVGHAPLILPGSVVLLINTENEILLQQREDGRWGIPGGLMELGESLEQTARREVKEETGLEIGELTLLGVFSGEKYYIKAQNGDEFYAVTAVYMTRDYKGKIQIDQKESLDMQFFSLTALPNQLLDTYKSYIHPYIKELQKK